MTCMSEAGVLHVPPGRLPSCPCLSLWLCRPFPTPPLDPTLRLPTYLPRAATGLCWLERAVSFLVLRWGPGHGRAGLAVGSVCPGKGTRGPSLLWLPGPLHVLWLSLVPDLGTQPRIPSVECHPTVTDWSGEHGKVETDSPVPTQVSPWGHKLVSSVAQSCPTLRPHESQHARPPCPSPTPGVHSTHIHRISDAIQPSHPLSSPSPLAPNPCSIRVFSNESTLCMRWPKYWSFSFSISPSNEHPGLISFRMDWLDLLAVRAQDIVFSLQGKAEYVDLRGFLSHFYVMYRCESLTITKAECWRIDAFKLWWRLWRLPWTARVVDFL